MRELLRRGIFTVIFISVNMSTPFYHMHIYGKNAIFSGKTAENQGWAPRPAGNPPRGEGGVPRPVPRCGEGGLPAPPRPVKMIKTAGKLRGKIKARISTFPIEETNDGTILQH